MKSEYASATVYVLSIVCLFPGESFASELLATYQTENSAGIAPQEEAAITFGLGLKPWDSVAPDVQLEAGVFWNEGGSGIIDFTTQSAVGFSDFAELATNGILDKYGFRYEWPDGQGGGGGGAESWLLHQYDSSPEQPDLIGYELDRVRMIVHGVHFEPWTPEPGSHGYMVEWDVTCQFFGTVVPEPTSVLLCVLGIASLRCGVRKRAL